MHGTHRDEHLGPITSSAGRTFYVRAGPFSCRPTSLATVFAFSIAASNPAVALADRPTFFLSILRCALEEALFLDRVLVMPSRMCLSSVHNTKGILHLSNATSEQRWETDSCAMESLYDIDLISRTVPVILDNPRSWYKLAYSSNFSNILEPIIENNYQLFMVERLIMQGARALVKTMKEVDSDLALCDDPKKNTKVWQEPVYTDD
ncbi:hypothetical protein PR202_ga29004 [Eleusine coracana subsp. coracana]|uniref:Uncharacterized protein n=1 Tax=Eleusine coracana subsp. coracana TaxID=191504 RepID=A0AAV5DKJ1_ELECO|nr:hypothetical protein PR202_ga29004 [Eleusine coracana subsp. coracana]